MRSSEKSCLPVYKKNRIASLLCIFETTKTFCMDVVFILFVCFVALRPRSTAIVMAGRSVHLNQGKLEQAAIQYSVHILSLVTDNMERQY